MLLRKLAPFLVVFIFVAIVGAHAAPLGKADYVITYTPTGETLEIQETLRFTPVDAQVYKEYCYSDVEHLPTKEYLAGITVYSKDYATSRGVRVGDPAVKVIELYGNPNRYSGSREHYKWLSYMEQSQILKMHFYLDKETERVIAINLRIYPIGAAPMIKRADGEYY
jgi:hypothetical protein